MLLPACEGVPLGTDRPEPEAAVGTVAQPTPTSPGDTVNPVTMPPWAARDLEAALAAGVDEPVVLVAAETPPEDAEPDEAEAEDPAPIDGIEAQARAIREARVISSIDATPLAPREGQSWSDFATRLLAEGRTGLAVRAYERAIAREGSAPFLLAGAGIAAMGEGSDAVAERYLRAALSEAPEDPAINIALGRLLMRQGRLESARNHFRTAFLVSSGQNELAVASLEDVDRRIAARRALFLPTTDREQAVTLTTIRTGPSTFLLDAPATNAEARAEDLATAAAPPDALLPDASLSEDEDAATADGDGESAPGGPAGAALTAGIGGGGAAFRVVPAELYEPPTEAAETEDPALPGSEASTRQPQDGTVSEGENGIESVRAAEAAASDETAADVEVVE